MRLYLLVFLILFPALALGQLINPHELPFGAYSPNQGPGAYFTGDILDTMHYSLGINQFTGCGVDSAFAWRLADHHIYSYPWGVFYTQVESVDVQTKYAGATYFVCQPESSAYYNVGFKIHPGYQQDSFWVYSGTGMMLGNLRFWQANKYRWLSSLQLHYSPYLKIGIDSTIKADSLVYNDSLVGIFRVWKHYPAPDSVLRFIDSVYVRDLPFGHDTLLALTNDGDFQTSYYTILDDANSEQSSHMLFEFEKVAANCTVYVDYLKITDLEGERLIDEQRYDAQIRQSVGRDAYRGKIAGWFIKDSQFPGNMIPFTYIDKLIRDTTRVWGADSVRAASHLTPRSGTGWWVPSDCVPPDTGSNDGYRDFVKLDHPKMMWSFLYPIWLQTQYTGYTQCALGGLQSDFQIFLTMPCDSIRAALSLEPGSSWMYVPQYWYCDPNDPVDPCTQNGETRRKPTPSELKCLTCIGLCYQPKGIMFYSYDTQANFGIGIVNTAGNPNPGMYDVIKDEINPFLKAIDSVYMDLTWERAYSVCNIPETTMTSSSGAYISSLHGWSDSPNPDTGWAQIGEFHNGSDKYIMLVNRACSSDNNGTEAPPQHFTLWLNPNSIGSNYVFITDLADTVHYNNSTHHWDPVPKTTYSAAMPDGMIPYTITLKAGEGKLLKISEASPMAWADTIKTGCSYQGKIYITADAIVPASETLKIEGPALFESIRCDSSHAGCDTDRVELIVNGNLIATGSPTDSIKFASDTTIQCNAQLTGHPQPGDWYGIRIMDSTSICNLNYCYVNFARYGVDSGSKTHVDVQNSNISNNADAGLCSHGYLKVTNSKIDNNSIYGILGQSADVDVDHCRLLNNHSYGIKLTGTATTSDSTLITYDTLSSNVSPVGNQAIYLSGIDKVRVYKCKARGNYQTGLYLSDSNALIKNNDFSSNQTYGIYADNGSFPIIRQCRIDTLSIGVKTKDSKPDMGKTSDYGNCTFRNCSSYYIYHVYKPATIDSMKAVDNYYGGPPMPSKFYWAYSNSPIKYNPYLFGAPPAPRLEVEPEIPLAFELHQNYPNPFNPTTTIAFTLDKPSQTLIAVYNLLGQRVITLLDEYRPAGEQALIWDGTDESGRQVSSGVYFYVIQAGEHFQSKKMTLLR